jgi:uncharacterized protein YndB with AHSA1/START domain
MSSEVIQTVRIDAGRDRTYQAIADPAEHTAFTGAPATVSDAVGSAFTTHGGAIEGQTLEVVPNERIVQAWRPVDWPAGVYSVVRYEFADDGDGTQITLTHTGLPDEGAEHIAEGWQERYWGPLADYLTSA